MKYEQMEKEALNLKPVEKAKLVTRLLTSLDKPDDEIEEKWKTEADNRVEALEKDLLETVTLDEVLGKYFS